MPVVCGTGVLQVCCSGAALAALQRKMTVHGNVAETLRPGPFPEKAKSLRTACLSPCLPDRSFELELRPGLSRALRIETVKD